MIELDDRPPFAAPWEAEAFALAVTLHEGGLFSWPEWTAALGARIAAAPGAPYYGAWLATVEQLVVERALTDEATLDRYREGWHRAAARTPHGMPIALLGEDLTPTR